MATFSFSDSVYLVSVYAATLDPGKQQSQLYRLEGLKAKLQMGKHDADTLGYLREVLKELAGIGELREPVRHLAVEMLNAVYDLLDQSEQSKPSAFYIQKFPEWYALLRHGQAARTNPAVADQAQVDLREHHRVNVPFMDAILAHPDVSEKDKTTLMKLKCRLDYKSRL